jgi:hypothetical protein
MSIASAKRGGRVILGSIAHSRQADAPAIEPSASRAVERRQSCERRACMPAKSKSQQKAAGAALAAKRGEMKKSELKGASRSMEKSMTEKELEELASTKRKGKPEHASKS